MSLEEHIAAIVPRGRELNNPLSDGAILEVQRILNEANASQWAERPRLYCLFRMCGRLNVIDTLVESGVTDGDLPLSESKLPVQIRVDEELRHNVIRRQHLVEAKQYHNGNESEVFASEHLPRLTQTTEVDQQPIQSEHLAHPLSNGEGLSQSPYTEINSTIEPKEAEGDRIQPDDKLDQQNLKVSQPLVVASKKDDGTGSNPHNAQLVKEPGRRLSISSFRGLTFHNPRIRSSIYAPERGHERAPTQAVSPTITSSQPLHGSSTLTGSGIMKPSQNPFPKKAPLAKKNLLAEALKQGKHKEAETAVRQFLDNDSLDAPDKGRDDWTYLHFTSVSRSSHLLDLLLTRKDLLDIGARTKAQDRTALDLAAQIGDTAAVTCLCGGGAAKQSASNFDGATALHRAVLAGHSEVASILCRKGANVDAKDMDGVTPLLYATQLKDLPSMRALLDAGADVEARHPISEITALQWAVTMRRVDMARLMLSFGADVDASSPYNVRAIHRAAIDGDQEMLRLLVEDAKCDVETKTEEGWSALHCAARYGRIDCYRMLVENGADPHSPNNIGITPFDALQDLGTQNKQQIPKELTLPRFAAQESQTSLARLI